MSETKDSIDVAELDFIRPEFENIAAKVQIFAEGEDMAASQNSAELFGGLTELLSELKSENDFTYFQ